MTGQLTFVAVPIGNARDITLRALDILRDADVLAAEDTRALRRLMEIHGLALNGRRLIAYHDHSNEKARNGVLALLSEGRHVAYASEAGTPLISDPGFHLARAAAGEGFSVTTAPGASAVTAALTLAALPTDRFLFAGFLPNTKSARRRALQELAPIQASLVLYESPKRIAALLEDALATMGNRPAALCRELTKRFEEVRRMPLEELCISVEDMPPKGEIVLVIDRAPPQAASQEDIDAALSNALDRLSLKDAAAEVAQTYGLNKRSVYQRALNISRRDTN
ncbi:MAG: 16S rRNA (cytidine(1402)-2'-O)-methyltransferase [Marinovum sp.]|nr:16S rRNA (cytidine(1402)-2'-O)-methyltransferase [Marinovum sp.]